MLSQWLHLMQSSMMVETLQNFAFLRSSARNPMGSSEDFLVEAKKDLSLLSRGQNICSSFSRTPNRSSTEFARSKFLSVLCLMFSSRNDFMIVLTPGVY